MQDRRQSNKRLKSKFFKESVAKSEPRSEYKLQKGSAQLIVLRSIYK